MESNGGKAELKDFTMIAGGAGGTIKINSDLINIIAKVDSKTSGSTIFKPSFSVKGGDPDTDLGAGGGGKVLLNCMTWDTNPNCIKVIDSTKQKFSKIQNPEYSTLVKSEVGSFKKIPSSPQYYMTMHMFEKVRKFVFNGGVINLNPCLPGHGGLFCQNCPTGFYKSSISTDKCIPCPCLLAFDNIEP
jgi:hypothetical protein